MTREQLWGIVLSMASQLPREFKETAAELLCAGYKISAVSRMLGICRDTVRNWIKRDKVLQELMLSARLRVARQSIRNRQNLQSLASAPLDSGIVPASVKLRALLELLKADDPATWDATYRRRIDEAEEPELFNAHIQFQNFKDERDARIQAENAAKALQMSEDDEEDLKGQQSLQLFIEDLRSIQHQAGLEAAKQADDYVEPEYG